MEIILSEITLTALLGSVVVLTLTCAQFFHSQKTQEEPNSAKKKEVLVENEKVAEIIARPG